MLADKEIKELHVGDLAPDFSLPDQRDEMFNLQDWRGRKNVLLIFYPGDDTPGCTTQLCALRDDFQKFTTRDTVIFGVNQADHISHQKFIDKYCFPFQLLIDRGRKISKKYGAVKSIFGQTTIKRSVVLINKKGKIIYLKRGLPTNKEILAAFPDHE